MNNRLTREGITTIMNESKIPTLNKLSGDAYLEKKKIIAASLVPKPEMVKGIVVISTIIGT